jgi:hypothetical protein
MGRTFGIQRRRLAMSIIEVFEYFELFYAALVLVWIVYAAGKSFSPV